MQLLVALPSVHARQLGLFLPDLGQLPELDAQAFQRTFRLVASVAQLLRQIPSVLLVGRNQRRLQRGDFVVEARHCRSPHLLLCGEGGGVAGASEASNFALLLAHSLHEFRVESPAILHPLGYVKLEGPHLRV